MKKHFTNKNIIKSEHYLDRYLKFMSSFKNQSKIKGITEEHHILPKSTDCFPEYQDLKLHPWNKINLPLKAHYIAHIMLAKAIGGKQWQALQLMGRLKNHSSITYKRIRQEVNTLNRCPIKREKISNSVSKLWEDETYRKNQCESHKGCFGLKNNNFKPVTIYNKNNIPIFTVLHNLKESLNILGYPGTSFKQSLYRSSLLYQSNRNADIQKIKNKGFYHLKGWYALHSLG